MRRLRRILPKDTAILVCLWSEGEATASLKAVLEQAEADAYATTLPEAVEICIAFAKGERGKKEEEGAEPAPPPALQPAKPTITPPPAPAPKSETAPAACSQTPPPRAARSSPLPRENHRPLLLEVVGGDEVRDGARDLGAAF